MNTQETIEETGKWELSVRKYDRPFRVPLPTANSIWNRRRGLVLCLKSQLTGKSGFGEVAPLPEFGTEDLETAEQFLQECGTRLTKTGIGTLLQQSPPACAFALWSALDSICDPEPSPAKVETAALLSINDNLIKRLPDLRAMGFRIFKVKLGIKNVSVEWEMLQELVDNLLVGEQLRLDPNRSWSLIDWAFWKPRLERICSWIEFLEDPFQFDESCHASLLVESNRDPVPLALDETLSTVGAIQRWIEQDWDGFWIIKPSVLGQTETWLPALEASGAQVVLSSVFETGIGLSAIVRLGARFPSTRHGLGTGYLFDDELGISLEGCRIRSLTHSQQSDLWNRLSPS